MKTVDVIFPYRMSSTIGPVGTIKRIIKNHNYFKSNGFNIAVFSPSGTIIKPINESIQNKVNSSTKKINLKKKIKNLIPYSYSLSALYVYHIYIQRKFFVMKYLEKNRTPDIVVFHSLFECYHYLKLRKNNSPRVILFQHSDCIPYKMEFIYFPKLKNKKFEKWLMNKYEFLVKNINKFAFITKVGMDNFRKINTNIDYSCLALILNGIDDFNAKEKQFIENYKQIKPFKYELVVTGTISKRKGQDIIIEALSILEDDILKDIHLTIIGDGNDKEKLEILTSKRGLEEHITFLGKIDNSEVYKSLISKDIFILMSENEGLPISIIEAMRSSLAIITTKNSGMPEIVKNGYNGLLLERNSDALLNIFKNIASYNWKQMGLHSRIRFENELTFDRMKQDYLKMLIEI